MLKEVVFEIPNDDLHFNFEKVSKRTHLDIASVNSACSIKINNDGVIIVAHLSAGGVAPIPKYLFKTSEYLRGKSISEENLLEALEIAQSEVSPISDARGSEKYKRLLLRQLLICHFKNIFNLKINIKYLLANGN